MGVYFYVYVYVCVYVCKCVCVNMHVRLHACAFACMCAYACVARIFTKLVALKAGFSHWRVHFSRFSLVSDCFRKVRDLGPL